MNTDTETREASNCENNLEVEEEEEEEEGEEEERVVKIVTAFDLLKEEMKNSNLPLMTFCKSLDLVLHGGMNMNMITEIYGDKGIGKTTFCCQLCLNIQIPESMEGHGAQSIFIDTEGSFSIRRLRVMARKLAIHCRAVSKECRLTVSSLLKGVHYIGCGSESELRDIIKGLHGYLAEQQRNVKLIVIDSLAHVYYTREGNFEDRVKKLFTLSQEIFELMNKFNLAVVVSNNMTTRFHPDGREYFIPYLGESWTHVPNQRIELTTDGTLRIARVIKCPKGYLGAAYYRVNSSGIRD